MRRRLRQLGYKQSQIDTMVKGDEKKKKTKTTTPTMASTSDGFEQEQCLPCKSSTISSDATRNVEQQDRVLLRRALGKPQSFQAFSNSASEPPLTSTEGDSYWDRVETSRIFLRNLGLHTNRPAPGAPSPASRAPPSSPSTGFPSSRNNGPRIKGSNTPAENDKVQKGNTPYPETFRPFVCDECHMCFVKLDDLRMHRQDHERGLFFCPSQACATVQFAESGYRHRDQLHRHAWRQHGISSQDVDEALATRASIATVPIDRTYESDHKASQEL